MSLTNEQQILLRMAICDGAFSTQGFIANGPLISRPIMADDLASIRAMSCEDILAVLVQYKVQKAAQLSRISGDYATQLANVNAKIADLQSALSTVQSVDLTPAI